MPAVPFADAVALIVISCVYLCGQVLLWAVIRTQAKRYGFQFGIRTLMLFIAVIAFVLAWLAATPEWNG
jgi:cbb3-type cytochrome oxidase subunit 3